MADLTPDDLTPVWTGKPVACAACLRPVIPRMGEDGWVIPVHRQAEETFPFRLLVCGGSMAPVTAMQTPKAMDERIEQRVVDAMPDRINDDWDTP